jgi:hypothetical protein
VLESTLFGLKAKDKIEKVFPILLHKEVAKEPAKKPKVKAAGR